MARRSCLPPTNDEFVGMADYIMESIHDLLVSDSKTIFDSASSQGSYDPSSECFMAEIANDTHRETTLEGRVASADDGTPHGGAGLSRILPMGTGLRWTRRTRPTHA
jgi:hypothetical protein